MGATSAKQRRELTEPPRECTIQVESVNVLGLGFTPLPHNNHAETQYQQLKTIISEHLDRLNATHDDDTISVLALQEDVYLRKELLNGLTQPPEEMTFDDLTTTTNTHERFARLPFLKDLLLKKEWFGDGYFSVHDGMPVMMDYLLIKSEDQLKELWAALVDGEGFDRDRLVAALNLDESHCHPMVKAQKAMEQLPLKLCSQPHSLKLGNTFFVKLGKNVSHLPIQPEVIVFETSKHPMYSTLPVRSAIRITIGGITPRLMFVNTHLVGGKFDDPQIWGVETAKNAPFDMLGKFLSNAPENVILIGDTNMRPECQMERTLGGIHAAANMYKNVEIRTQDCCGQWASKAFGEVAFDSDGKLKPETVENARHAWYITNERLRELSDPNYPGSHLFMNDPHAEGGDIDTGAFGGHVDVCLWRSSSKDGLKFVRYAIIQEGTPLMWKENPTDRMYKHGGSDHLAQCIVFKMAFSSRAQQSHGFFFLCPCLRIGRFSTCCNCCQMCTPRIRAWKVLPASS